MSYLLTASQVAESYAELFTIANRDTLRKQINTVTADIRELEYRYSALRSHVDRNLTPMYLGQVFRPSDVSKMLTELELTIDYLAILKAKKTEPKTEPKTFELLTNEQRKNLLIGALEGGSNYWYFLPLNEGYNLPSYSINSIWAAILEGKTFNIHDLEDEDEKLGELSLQNIIDNEYLMYKNSPSHFGDILSDNDDANTADVWFQYVTLSEIVFG
jgi:hypothetical protein